MKTVKQVSELTGVSVRTLHHYDEIGLLKPAQVTEAGYRLYDDVSLQRLHAIMLLKELQFPLKEIRNILDSPGFDPMQALQQQIELLELQKADYFATGTKPAPGPFPEISRLIDEILEEAACFSIRDLAINGTDLLALGFAPGPKLGQCLEALLRLVQEDAIPNEKEALLRKAKESLL